MKKISFILAIILICTVAFVGCDTTSEKTDSTADGTANSDTTEKTIGIIQFGNHPSLNNCYDGIVKGLTEGGIDLNEYKIDLQISNFEASVSATQANSFANKKVSIIGAIATPSALAAASAVQGEIPVVYTAISDPVSAGLTEMDNVAGSSDNFDFDNQLKLIRAFLPDATKIGVIYSTTEDNSISQIATLKAKAPNYGFEIIEKSITNTNEIPTAADTLIAQGIDCLNNLTDNTVVGCLDLILEKTNAANIPIFGSEVTQVERGCLASASLDYLELGRQTGLYMAEVLKGKAVEKGYVITLSESYLCYNSEVASNLGVTTPTGFDMKDVK